MQQTFFDSSQLAWQWRLPHQKSPQACSLGIHCPSTWTDEQVFPSQKTAWGCWQHFSLSPQTIWLSPHAIFSPAHAPPPPRSERVQKTITNVDTVFLIM